MFPIFKKRLKTNLKAKNVSHLQKLAWNSIPALKKKLKRSLFFVLRLVLRIYFEWGLFSFHRISRKWSHLKEEPKIMGKPGGLFYSCHSSGEMSLGKFKFSIGDVICEFKSGAKNDHISWTNEISTSKFRLSQWNLSPFRLTPLPTHFVMGRKLPIETIVDGILHRPYGKSL